MIRHLKIGTRAYLNFASIGVLVLALVVFSWQSISAMRAAQIETGQQMLPTATTVNRLTELTLRLRVLSYWLLANREPATVERITGLIKQRYEQLKDQQKKFEKLIVGNQQRRFYDAYNNAMNEYAVLFPKLLNLSTQGDVEALRILLNNALNDNHNAALTQLNLLAEQLEARTIQVNAAVDAEYRHAFVLFLSFVTGVFLIGSVLAWISVRSIQRPLHSTVEIADRIAQGDLRMVIEPTGSDELTDLQRSMQTMQTKLATTLGVVIKTTDQLTTAAGNLQRMATSGAQNANEETCQVEQVATAFNEMSMAVENVAANAVTTAEVSRTSANATQQGNRLVSDAIAAIVLLSTDVSDSSVRVKAFAAQAVGINQILEEIRSVADQTNLLALNAAIEAARAGELGRGFAVVADEVRTLASRSRTATLQIEQVVNGITSGAEDAVSAIDRSVVRASATVKVAEGAGAALNEIGSAIDEISDRNQVIASAAEEQASVTKEIERSLELIRHMAGEGAESAQKTNLASEGLTHMAQELREVLASFKVPQT